MNFLEPGEVYQKLPTSYVIFITETDALGYHLPIYHISRKIRENGKDFPDRAHIIYVDSKNQEDTELGRLMQIFIANCRKRCIILCCRNRCFD